MRITSWLFGLCAALTIAAPQPADASVENLLRWYSLTSWVEGDGRPLGSVYAIVQDGDGYLWIGADAGLFRFDGSGFTPWNTLSRTTLPPVAVRALSVTRDGGLLIGLADGAGVREARNGSLIDLGYQGPPDNDVTEIIEDREGVIWIVSGRVLYVLRGDTWEKVQLPWPHREGLVLQPFVTRGGDLFVGTRWGVFRRAAHTTDFQEVSGEYVWGLTEDDAGQIWTTDIVAGYRSLGAPEPPRRELEGAGYRVMHDHRGNLWVATFGKGLWRVHDSQNDGTASIEVANLRTGLSSDSIQSMLEDGDGNIWVGTTGGLHRLKVRALTPVEDVGFVVAMAPAEGHGMWAGTTNGVIRFVGSPGRWERVGSNSGGPDVRSLYGEADGTLWVGASEGLWRLRDGRLTHVPLPPDRRLVVMFIAPHAQSGLWLGDGEWLYRWNGSELSPFDRPDNAPDLERITFARADSRGRIWLGLSGGRIGILASDGSLSFVGAKPGTGELHDDLYTLLEDRNGDIWLGGSAGLSLFENGSLTTVSTANGLPGNEVRAMVEDLQGRFWLSIDRGLVRVERSEIVKALTDRGHRIRYRLYDTQDGLAGAPVGIIGATMSGDGTLWFVRGGGVTVLNSQAGNDTADASTPYLRVESVVANDRPSNPLPSASFPAGTTRIEIRYTALSLSSSDGIRFRYRLDGVDTGWVDAGPRRTASYTNLSPGTYRFHVDVDESGEEDLWGIQPATWTFSIQPAFYQTPGFAVIGLGLVLCSAWGAWQFRLRMIRRRFSLALAERARVSREIHDTLLQSLVGVTLQFDAIAASLSPSSTDARKKLTNVRREVEAYIRDARQSISDLRSPLLEAADLVSVLKDFGKRTVGTSGVRIATSVIGTPRQYSPKIDNQLLRIGQEAIVNAVRHAGASRIHVEIRFDKEAVTLRVVDNGHGFEPGSADVELEQHYGLTTMRERAEEIGAHFSVASSASGTVVETVVSVPRAARGA